MQNNGYTIEETVPASRKLGAKEARDLIREADTVVVMKGKAVRQFSGGSASKELVAALLGPTGNLRAPVLRLGGVLLVGFNEETFASVL